MRKIFFILAIALIFLTAPIVSACLSTTDDYAVEVLLNSPNTDYNLALLNSAENINHQDTNLIAQSEYSSNLSLVLSEGVKICDQSFCSKSLSIRLQLPVKMVQKQISYLLFISDSAPGQLNISRDSLSYPGWDIECDNIENPQQCEFKENGITLYVNPIANSTKSEIMIELTDSLSNSCSMHREMHIQPDWKILYKQ